MPPEDASPGVRLVPFAGAESGILFEGAQTVVFDILRATTTMTVAFENGARAVRPAGSVEAARDMKMRSPGALLAGEVDLEPPAGFDLGNAPAQYTRRLVGDREIVLATTNGTRALHAARESALLLAGSFRNLSATVGALKRARPLILFCSGREGAPADEDLAAAGAVMDRLGVAPPGPDAERALALWHEGRGNLGAFLAATPNGRRLLTRGYGEDVRAAAVLDAAPFAVAVRGGVAAPADTP